MTGAVSGAETPGQEVGSGEVAGVEIGGVEHSVLIPTTTHDTRKKFQKRQGKCEKKAKILTEEFQLEEASVGVGRW